MFLLFGTLFSLSLFLIIFFINEIPFKNFLIQYIFYPSSLGEGRVDRLNIDFKNSISQFKFIYLALIPLAIATFFLLQNQKKKDDKKKLLIAFLFFGSIIIFVYSQLLTKNQILIFSLIPISAALSHAYSQKYLKKKYFIYFILIIFIFSTLKYHFRYRWNTGSLQKY